MAQPVGITVVSCGRSDVRRFYDKLYDSGESPEDWEHCDLPKYLVKDPATSVGHHEDGTFPQTQRCVVRQARFPEVLIYYLNLVCGVATDRPGAFFTKFLFSCESGWHRASTVAMFFCCLLNYVVRNSLRSFNAMHFGLHDCYGKFGFPTRIQHAIQWSNAPWNVIDGGIQPRHTLYAYTACAIDPVASHNWHLVYNEVDAAHAEMATGGDPSPSALPVNATDAVAEPSSLSNVAPLPVVPHVPMQPVTPPPHVRASVSASDVPPDASRNSQASGSSGIPPPPPPPVRAGTVEVPPSWFTFSRDINVWWATLRSEGIDEGACKSLLLLAQHSDAGFRAANSLIAKLYKKRADGEIMSNPSGFVHKCSLNARHRIDQEEMATKKPRW